jgi:ribosome-associated protein
VTEPVPEQPEIPEDTIVVVDESLSVPRAELTFRATRSGGPGGQHVNTSSTRVELTWRVTDSPSLTDDQRARIAERLANRLDGEGVLRLTEGGSRSQHQNRQAVVERFRRLLADALRVPKRRRRTRPPAAAREERLRAKKRRSAVKRARGPVTGEE